MNLPANPHLSNAVRLNSIHIRIRAEGFYKVAVRAKLLDRLRNFFVLRVAVAINEEKIFPCLALARARFDFRQINLEFAERGDGFVQCADFVGNADHQTRAVIARRRTALATKHEKARRIRRVVLNVLFKNSQFVFLGSKQ